MQVIRGPLDGGINCSCDVNCPITNTMLRYLIVPGSRLLLVLPFVTFLTACSENGRTPFQKGIWTGAYTPASPPATIEFVLSVDGVVTDPVVQFTGHAFGPVQLPFMVLKTDTIRLRLPDDLGAPECSVTWQLAGWFIGPCSRETSPGTLALSPPSHDIPLPNGLMMRALTDSAIAWETTETESFHVHISPAAMLSDSARSAVTQLEGILTEAEELLHEKISGSPIHMFVASSVAELSAATGRAGCGFFDLAAHAAFVVITDRLACSHRHELMHVASLRAWGRPKPPFAWISEGVATWFETRDALGRFRTCIGQVEAVAVHLAKSDSLLSMVEVIKDHHANNNGLRATIQSPALIGYLHDRWGIAAVKAAWFEGVAGLTQYTGMTLQKILRDWQDHLLSSSYGDHARDWRSVLENGCPRS